MTLSTLTSRVSYPGAGSTGPFAIPFRFLATADLLVTRRSAVGTETTLALTTHYTLTGANEATGNLTLVTALAVGETLVIRRKPALTQPTSIRNQGAYFPATIEDEFDRLAMQLQDLQDQLDRSFGVSESYAPATLTLRVKPEVGKVLGWDSSSLLTNKALDASATALPGSGRTVGTLSAYLANNSVFNVADWGASAGASAAVNTAAIQAAIFASLNISSLADQPTGRLGAVLLKEKYPITQVFAPRYTQLQGLHTWAALSSSYDGPILVLGRSATAETDWIDITLRDFEIGGDLTKTNQVGIKASFSGVGGYAYPLDFRNVSVKHMGGIGIELVGDNIACALIKTTWDNVMVYDTTSYSVHIKVGVFNAAQFNNCVFTDCGNGFFVEDFGSGTQATEAIKFQNTQFEALGTPLAVAGVGTVSSVAGAATFSTSQAGKLTNGSTVTVNGSTYNVSAFNGTTGATLSGAPTFGALAFSYRKYTIGSFGFKSTVYTGQYIFDSCYNEGCGNGVGDTTGAGYYVRAPWQLYILGGVLASSNNLVWMAYGGQGRMEGVYIFAGVANTAILTLDQPQPGSDYSNFHIGKNRWASGYTYAQMVRVINGSLTTVTGFRDSANYSENPSRFERLVFRDGRTKDADDGAIAYTRVKRLTNNAGGATLIVTNGIATICKNTVFAKIIITEPYSTTTMAEFLLTAGGGIALVGQRGASWTVTKDNASTLNVYHDVPLQAWVVQNKLATSAQYAVCFIGCEPMAQADNGYYETQFA